jgi:hypothetical protein
VYRCARRGGEVAPPLTVVNCFSLSSPWVTKIITDYLYINTFTEKWSWLWNIPGDGSRNNSPAVKREHVMKKVAE